MKTDIKIALFGLLPGALSACVAILFNPKVKTSLGRETLQRVDLLLAAVLGLWVIIAAFMYFVDGGTNMYAIAVAGYF